MVNTYSEFQVNIFEQSKQRYDQMSQFLHDDDNDEDKATEIPRVLYENSRAQNSEKLRQMSAWVLLFANALTLNPFPNKKFYTLPN